MLRFNISQKGFAVLMLTIGLLACSEPQPLNRYYFHFESVQFTMDLPKKIVPNQSKNIVRISVGSRTPDWMLLTYSDGNTTKLNYEKSLVLLPSIQYTIKMNVGGGSGGQENRLAGSLKIGKHEFSVSCGNQSEPPMFGSAAKPDFCLAWIKTIRLINLPKTYRPVTFSVPKALKNRPKR